VCVCVCGKGKVAPVLYLSIMPRRRIGEWRYSSTQYVSMYVGVLYIYIYKFRTVFRFKQPSLTLMSLCEVFMPAQRQFSFSCLP
jgi:hypothetical protein